MFPARQFSVRKHASLRPQAASHQRPAGQGRQAVPFDTVGPTQEAHTEAFQAYNGEVHATQEAEPATDTVPAGQAVHELRDVEPAAENVPGGQAMQENVPNLRNVPAGQISGEDEEDGVAVEEAVCVCEGDREEV